MKPKRIFLLLTIGAAVILTVIWSTRGISKPNYQAAVQPEPNDKNGFTNSARFSNLDKNDDVIQLYQNVSYGDQDQDQSSSAGTCSVLQSSSPDIDTSEIYPTLNFNVINQNQIKCVKFQLRKNNGFFFNLGEMDSLKRILERSHGKKIQKKEERIVAEITPKGHSHAAFPQRSRMAQDLRRLLPFLNANDSRQRRGQAHKVFKHDLCLDGNLVPLPLVGLSPRHAQGRLKKAHQRRPLRDPHRRLGHD